MAMPALVLVHGGGLAADSWELTVGEIQRIAPQLTVLAPDLPGRRDKPGDLHTLTVADCVESRVDDIERAGLDDIFVVGHSMAGLIVPGVVTKLGSSRVRELIFAPTSTESPEPSGNSWSARYIRNPPGCSEKVSRQGMPDDVPRTWILTLRDRALTHKVQRKYIESLGGVQTLIKMDTCHCLMVSEPKRLAQILVERCQLYE